MFNIVLFEPEIPPNTGNIIRLCANTGCRLHLIEPLGFIMDDKRLRRAGLDYGEWRSAQTYSDWQAFMQSQTPQSLYMLSTKGTQRYTEVKFKRDDYLVFGPETRGLPAQLRQSIPAQNVLKVPMCADSRSMNLSNTVAVIVYEAWRQCDFYNAV